MTSYTVAESGNVVVDGVEYPFTEPTHRVVSGVEVLLTEEEKEHIVQEWVEEYNRPVTENI